MNVLLLFASLFCLLIGTTPLEAGAGLDPKVGQPIAATANFKDESGRPFNIAHDLKDRPAVLALVYFSCPNQCTILLKNLVKGLGQLDRVERLDYDVYILSIDPLDTVELAQRRKELALKEFERQAGHLAEPLHWHFLTGQKAEIDRIAASIGFRYRKNAEDYEHPSAITLLTSDAKVSQYLYGLSYPAKDLEKALDEASRGTFKSNLTKFLMICAHFLPLERGDSLTIMNGLRSFSLVFLFGTGYLIRRHLKGQSS